MADNNQLNSADSPQKDIVEHQGNHYEQLPADSVSDTKTPPRRKWGEKVVKGIIVGRGDKAKVIELEQVQRLASLHCSYQDMANFFGVAESTLKDNFRWEIEVQRANTKHRLLESLIENAVTKQNVTAQIWLSKQWCGFADNPQSTNTGQVLPWVSADQPDHETD
jgi:hypothetical protein